MEARRPLRQLARHDLDAGSAGDDDPAQARSCATRGARRCAWLRLALRDDAAAELAPYEGAAPQHAGLPRAAALAASLQTDAAVSATCDGDGAQRLPRGDPRPTCRGHRADAAARLEACARRPHRRLALARRRALLRHLLAGADGGDGGGGRVEGWPFGGWLRLRQAAAYAPDAQAIAPLPSPAAEEDEQAC